MPNTKKTKDILNRIEIEKELLSTMPVNNEKNRKKFLDKISELKEEYQKYEAMIFDIFNKRYQRGIEGEVSTWPDRAIPARKFPSPFGESATSFPNACRGGHWPSGRYIAAILPNHRRTRNTLPPDEQCSPLHPIDATYVLTLKYFLHMQFIILQISFSFVNMKRYGD